MGLLTKIYSKVQSGYTTRGIWIVPTTIIPHNRYQNEWYKFCDLIKMDDWLCPFHVMLNSDNSSYTDQLETNPTRFGWRLYWTLNWSDPNLRTWPTSTSTQQSDPSHLLTSSILSKHHDWKWTNGQIWNQLEFFLLIFFILKLIAFKNGWLRTVPTRSGRINPVGSC